MSSAKCSVINLVIDNCFLCIKFESNRSPFRRFLGYECHLAVNAVVLVLGRYQISKSTYLREISTLI